MCWVLAQIRGTGVELEKHHVKVADHWALRSWFSKGERVVKFQLAFAGVYRLDSQFGRH